MKIIFDFPSVKWIPDIQILAQNFLSFLAKEKNSRFLELDLGRLENIQPYYYANMIDFKQRTYGKDADTNNIDHHKILAIYIKSILVNKPFSYPKGIKKDILRIELLANEFFCVSLMEAVFMAWNTDGMKKVLKIPKHELGWFIKLLHQFRNSPETLDILSLSQSIYYIERNFFVLF